jgi:hypothetical protein
MHTLAYLAIDFIERKIDTIIKEIIYLNLFLLNFDEQNRHNTYNGKAIF